MNQNKTMNKTNFSINPDKKSFTVERQFSAQQDKVWEAYTNSQFLDRWFAPTGWECRTKEFAFENGGSWIYSLTCTDPEQADFFGMEMSGQIIYDSIEPQHSFAYTDAFLNEEGSVDDNMPSSYTNLTLTKNQEGTLLSFTTTYPSEEALEEVIVMGAQSGLDESFAKLSNIIDKV